MPPRVVTPAWTTLTKGRTCGSCYACCVHLDIGELRKWGGQACKHLDGRDPAKRCSIYAHRPEACRSYACEWLNGFGPEDLKPSESGLLLSGYPDNEVDDDGKGDGQPSVTITICEDKPGIAERAEQAAAELLMTGAVRTVRSINRRTMRGMLFHQGTIYRLKYLKPKQMEMMSFEAEAVGHYHEERL